jgi:hypothetical protein
MTSHQGMSLREAKALASRLGVKVELVNRTGEVRFTFPGRVVAHNARRKCASRALVVQLRRLEGDSP